jgi:hypothetical protein
MAAEAELVEVKTRKNEAEQILKKLEAKALELEKDGAATSNITVTQQSTQPPEAAEPSQPGAVELAIEPEAVRPAVELAIAQPEGAEPSSPVVELAIEQLEAVRPTVELAIAQPAAEPSSQQPGAVELAIEQPETVQPNSQPPESDPEKKRKLSNGEGTESETPDDIDGGDIEKPKRKRGKKGEGDSADREPKLLHYVNL